MGVQQLHESVGGDAAAGADGRGWVVTAGELTSEDGGGLADTLASVTDRLAAGDYGGVEPEVLVDLLETLERCGRAMSGIGYELIARLREHDARTAPGRGSLRDLLIDRLRITAADARGRIRTAEELAPRVAMTGQRLPARREATAAARRSGSIGAEHARIIVAFLAHLPADVDPATRCEAEGQLVGLARRARPEHVRAAAERLRGYLDPDGSDGSERARRRKVFFQLHSPGPDGLSTGRFCVDAELRAYLEALFAVYAKPGRCNPDDPAGDTGGGTSPNGDGPDSAHADEPGADDGDARDGSGGLGEHDAAGSATSDDAESSDADDDAGAAAPAGQFAAADPGTDTDPGTDAEPDAEAGAADGSEAGGEPVPAWQRDLRTQGQRNADAVKAALRAILASGDLGSHRGLPVRVVITARLADLEQAAGCGLTAGGSLVPMREVIRMASHAYQYLSVFDDVGRPLYLGRSKRIANPAQRLVLYAGDGGCTFPGCTSPGQHCQVHHVDEWAHGGDTDVDRLTLACERHHRLVGDGHDQWATTRTGPGDPYPGRTLWHPPAAVDPERRGRINHYHHPGEFLTGDQHHRYPRYRDNHQQRRHRNGTRVGTPLPAYTPPP